MNWEPFPSAQSILKLLISIPYHLRLPDLYDSNQEEDRLYVINSLIVFNQNHYYAYMLQTVT